MIGNIHYAPINDLAWAGNETLIACSSDGYCSIMSFKDGNLIGQRLPNEQIEDLALQQHFTNMDTVNYKRLEMQVKNQKGQQF